MAAVKDTVLRGTVALNPGLLGSFASTATTRLKFGPYSRGDPNRGITRVPTDPQISIIVPQENPRDYVAAYVSISIKNWDPSTQPPQDAVEARLFLQSDNTEENFIFGLKSGRYSVVESLRQRFSFRRSYPTTLD